MRALDDDAPEPNKAITRFHNDRVCYNQIVCIADIHYPPVNCEIDIGGWSFFRVRADNFKSAVSMTLGVHQNGEPSLDSSFRKIFIPIFKELIQELAGCCENQYNECPQ
ncbi:MAG: hypothetical protein AABO57_23540 [Acidobacteriota bacterium]